MEQFRALVRFAVHTFIGLLVGILIAVPALLLHLLLKYVDGLGLPQFVVIGLTFFEKGIFAVDLMLLSLFYLSEAWKLARKTLSHGGGTQSAH